MIGAAFFLMILTTLLVVHMADLDKDADRIGLRFATWLGVLFGAEIAIGSWFAGKIRDVVHVDGLTARGLARFAPLAIGAFATLLATGYAALACLLAWDLGYRELPQAFAGLPPQFVWSVVSLCVVVAVAALPISWMDVRERDGLDEWVELEIE